MLGFFRKMVNDLNADTVKIVPQVTDEKYVEPASYAEKRARAKALLGKKWLLHPDNTIQRAEPTPSVLSGRK